MLDMNCWNSIVHACWFISPEQCCSNRPEQHCWQQCSQGAAQHCSRLFRTVLFRPVDNLQQVVRFYACSCDMVSWFSGRGKKTCWNTWNAVEHVTQAFCALTTIPNAIDHWFQTLERFVVLLYDRTSSLYCVNEVRKVLFTKKGRQLGKIPPTKAALLQHVTRAVYKTVNCWGQMLIRTQENFQFPLSVTV